MPKAKKPRTPKPQAPTSLGLKTLPRERWHVEESHASVPEDPFVPELVLSAGARDLLLRCDGTRSVLEVLASFADADADLASIVEVAMPVLVDLLERGLLQLPT